MEKYRLVHETKVDDENELNTTPNRNEAGYPEVRIMQQGKPRNYISYAMNLFVRASIRHSISLSLYPLSSNSRLLTQKIKISIQNDGSPTIVLKAMGRAINKVVTIAEILKRKMKLHQWNTLSSVEMVDIYEPVEEGLDVVESRRYVSCMTITLSLHMLDDMGTDHSGYQPPLPSSEMQQRSFDTPSHVGVSLANAL